MPPLETIRNFSIIAHIDHGKSTLADRMIEVTQTLDKRQMRDQVLDDMELERERGITIKMRPVRMHHTVDGKEYVLNLIDTPGHIDFSYEVSRALQAVEGTVLLVDASQGVQAQTISVLSVAQRLGLKIVPVLSKVDSPRARIDEVTEQICELVGCMPDEVLLTSGKTGVGVKELLDTLVERVPAPSKTYQGASDVRALVFDFQYSNHRGVIVYSRMLDGQVKKGDQLQFSAAGEKFYVLETGTFNPAETTTDSLSAGEIGYIVTGIKQPGIASVGDTLVLSKNTLPPLDGYDSPKPVVWASIFPESQDDFDQLRQALQRLRLSDSSFTFEEESSSSLGRGFRSGFLGMLHLEIVAERLRREFNLELVITLPSITYEVETRNGKVVTVYSPQLFPDYGDIVRIREPWTLATIIAPEEYLNGLMQVLFNHEAEIRDTTTFGLGRVSITAAVPLRELMRNFFDDVKSISSGYASLSYEWEPMRDADVVKVDMLVADEVFPAFTRIVARRRLQEEAEKMVRKLHGALPRQMFTTKIQARSLGRIVSSETLSAMKKDVTGYLYGGDITRKMKLREKQKKGKKKMKERGTVNISHDVFLKMIKPEE